MEVVGGWEGGGGRVGRGQRSICGDLMEFHYRHTATCTVRGTSIFQISPGQLNSNVPTSEVPSFPDSFVHNSIQLGPYTVLVYPTFSMLHTALKKWEWPRDEISGSIMHTYY